MDVESADLGDTGDVTARSEGCGIGWAGGGKVRESEEGRREGGREEVGRQACRQAGRQAKVVRGLGWGDRGLFHLKWFVCFRCGGGGRTASLPLRWRWEARWEGRVGPDDLLGARGGVGGVD